MSRSNRTGPDKFMEGIGNLPAALGRMGFDGFRPGQEKVVSSIMSGKDTICVLPTGTGKSACFIIPGLAMRWGTLVFSPLVALMRDQVRSLWDKDIPAGQVSGMQTPAENVAALKAWASGEIDFLYVAPERLRNEMFRRTMDQRPPDFVTLDEAHTLSQWSDNFRPDYVKVGDFIAERNPAVVAAFTATCPQTVEDEVRRVLGIPDARLTLYYPRRTNLKPTSRNYTGSRCIAQAVQESAGSTIVYCATVKEVMRVAADLSDWLPDDRVVFFHGQLDASTKRANQDDFMSGRARVVVATNAFGMGIDKEDIRAVIHRDMPGSIEQLSQEIGRAGRDGKDSLCVAFYDQKSYDTQKFFVDSGNPPSSSLRAFYETIRRHADANMEVRMTVSELVKEAGVSEIYSRSLMSILVGAQILERFSEEGKGMRIKLTEAGRAARLSDARMSEVMDVIDEGGVMVTGSYIEFSLDWAADRWGKAPSTLKTWIRQWDRDGLLDMIEPFRGKVTRIVGGLDRLDMARLAQKAREDREKLESVLKYFATPDDEKHAYMESHFDLEDRNG